MKGFIQIPILILFLVGTGASVYLVQQKTHFFSQALSNISSKEITDLFTNQQIATKSAAQPFDYQLPTSTTTNSSAPSLLSAFQRLLQRKTSQSPPSSAPVNISPAPTFKPTVSPSPTPVTPNYSTNTSSTCAINVGATPLDPNSNFDNPLTILLTYSAHYTGNKYVTGAQWDFNGDGSWDTDMSLSNGSIPHTFPRSGSYNIRMQLRMSDGTMTPVCSKTATIPIGLAVSLTGHVFRDVNCNNLREANEQGISGVTVNFFKMPAFNLYATTTSDSNGYYSLIKVINFGDSLSIQPGDIAAPGYKINALHQAITLNSSRPSGVYDLPQVPNENIGLCFSTPVPTPTPSPTNDPNTPVVSSISTMTATPGDRVTIYGSNFLNPGTTDVTTLQVWLVHNDGGVNTLASVSPNTGNTEWDQDAISFTIGQVIPQSGQLKVLAGNRYANVPGVFTIISR